MANLEVRIVTLEPMRIASVRAFSPTPERDAWDALRAWAEPRGFLRDPQLHPVFGFNNPNPSPERPEYGYELWIGVAPEADVEGGVETKQFPGGMYATARCALQEVTDTWKQLWKWVQSSPYRWRRTHELEKVENPGAPEPEILLELYLPIEPRLI